MSRLYIHIEWDYPTEVDLLSSNEKLNTTVYSTHVISSFAMLPSDDSIGKLRGRSRS